MTVLIESAMVGQKPTRWQKLRTWLTAIDEVMNYDPQEYNYGAIRQLREAVAKLESRITELEE